jgi:hypothetical protein
MWADIAGSPRGICVGFLPQKLRYRATKPSLAESAETRKPARNVVAPDPDGTIFLPQKLDYHDIGVISRNDRKLRFIADDDAIARREPDRPYVNPTMIGNQIRRTWRRQPVMHHCAFA